MSVREAGGLGREEGRRRRAKKRGEKEKSNTHPNHHHRNEEDEEVEEETSEWEQGREKPKMGVWGRKNEQAKPTSLPSSLPTSYYYATIKK